MIHLLRTLCKAQKFAWVKVYSPTAFTGVWGSIAGEDNVEAVFDADELESILESQASIRSRGGKNEGLVILDDCLGACSFQNDLWTRIASSGATTVSHFGSQPNTPSSCPLSYVQMRTIRISWECRVTGS
jgi:hypothetical protein